MQWYVVIDEQYGGGVISAHGTKDAADAAAKAMNHVRVMSEFQFEAYVAMARHAVRGGGDVSGTVPSGWPDDRRCKGCLFYAASASLRLDLHTPAYRGDGFCRRYPPVLMSSYFANVVVQEEHWCGEWSPAGRPQQR